MPLTHTHDSTNKTRQAALQLGWQTCSYVQFLDTGMHACCCFCKHQIRKQTELCMEARSQTPSGVLAVCLLWRCYLSPPHAAYETCWLDSRSCFPDSDSSSCNGITAKRELLLHSSSVLAWQSPQDLSWALSLSLCLFSFLPSHLNGGTWFSASLPSRLLYAGQSSAFHWRLCRALLSIPLYHPSL